MPTGPLETVPAGSNIFIDANIFIYALSGLSAQCRELLVRCAREEVIGVSSFLVVSEVTHRLMLAEARSKGFIAAENASSLRRHRVCIEQLVDYWRDTERILSMNLLLLEASESALRSAQSERRVACLLTNDSIIVSSMRQYGIRLLASSDADFDRVPGITVFGPDDLPQVT